MDRFGQDLDIWQDSVRVLEDYTKRSPADKKMKAILVEKIKIVELAPWTPAKGGG